MRATRWHCCGAVAFWEVPRYGDVIRHSAEERPIKHTLIFSLKMVLSDFIDLTQVHNFTVSAQDILSFRRLSVFTVSFARILQVLMQIMKRFALYY